MTENVRINLSDAWIPVTNNRPIKNGPYLVTAVNSVDSRTIGYALYNENTGWTFLANDGEEKRWNIIAYLPEINHLMEPYLKPVMKFQKGDIIVWTHPTYKKTSWMLIRSFDYQSDKAARAVIGKSWFGNDMFTIYGDWVPNNFGDDVHIATEEEKQVIYKEMLNHFKNDYKIKKGAFTERNVGYETMILTLDKAPVIREVMKEMWNVETAKKETNE